MDTSNGRDERYEYTEEMLQEFETLYLENCMLRGELATLNEEFEQTSRVILPNAQTNYQIKVGTLRLELLQQQIAVLKTRRRIAILRSTKDMDSLATEDAINYCLDMEFRDDDDRLRLETIQVEAAKARFSSLTPPEDEEEVRAIYRLLARKMNPEINTDMSTEARSFWPSIHAAYVNGDLFHIKALLMMSEDYPDNYDLPSNMGKMYKDRDELLKKIRQVSRQIENLKKNPAWDWHILLADPQKLAAEQARLRAEIHHAKAERAALQDMLTTIEVNR